MFVHKKICLPTDQLIESEVRDLLVQSQENCTLCGSNLLMSQDNNYKSVECKIYIIAQGI